MTCLRVDMNFTFDCSRWQWTTLRNTFHGIYELSEPLHHAVWFLSHTVENICSWSQYLTRLLHLFVKYWLENEKMRICICCRSFYSLGQFLSCSGQFFSAKVNLFQTRSSCFNLGHLVQSDLQHIYKGMCNRVFYYADIDEIPRQWFLGSLFYLLNHFKCNK